MKTLDKLYKLHNILKSARSYIPTKELLEKLDCSDSTLEKTIRELRDIYGAPLNFNKKYKGYKYEYEDGEKFELPGIWFSGDELGSLFAIHQILSEVPDGLLYDKLTQIKERIAKTAESASLSPEKWAQVIKIIPMAYRKPNDVAFRVAVEGVIRSKRIDIVYEGALKPASQRIVSPIRLVRYRDNWYMDGYCHNYNELRQFELSRIKTAKITNYSSESVSKKMQDEFFADSYGIFSGKANKVAVIKFYDFAAKIVSKEKWHKKQTMEYDQNAGVLTVRIPYNDDRELIRDVMRWGQYAEFIEPQELRDSIKKILQATLEKY